MCNPEIPLQGHTGVLEPDSADNLHELDSAFGDDLSSELTSITSSITDYVYRNGRRYAGHRDSAYFLPNDEAEQDRNDLVYHIYSMLFGGVLVFSGIKEPQRILDIGTGTGIWAMDVGDQYPAAEVIGTDLSPIQPSWVPPNVRFEIDNAEADWAFSRPFDLIHIMNLNGHIRDWKRFLLQTFDNLKPGAYVEIKETELNSTSDDGTLPNDCSLVKFHALCLEGSAKHGMSLLAPLHIKGWLQEIGFVDIQDRTYKLPLSPWPKDKELKLIGRVQLMQALDTLQPYGIGLLVDALGWSRDEMEVLLSGIRSDLKNLKYHGYNTTHVFTARKPESA